MISHKKAHLSGQFYYREPDAVAAVPKRRCVGAADPPLVWIQLSG